VQGKLDEAVAACRRAIAIKPDLAEPYCNLGIAFAEQGKLDEAISACRFKSNYAEAYSNLARAHRRLGKIDNAAKAFEDWYANDPENPIARHMRAASTGRDAPGARLGPASFEAEPCAACPIARRRSSSLCWRTPDSNDRAASTCSTADVAPACAAYWSRRFRGGWSAWTCRTRCWRARTAPGAPASPCAKARL